MAKQEILDRLKDGITNLDEARVYSLVKQGLKEGLSPADIINDGLNAGLTELGEGLVRGKQFLSDLMVAGNIMTNAMEILRPVMEKGVKATGDVMVLGTVEGSFHTIGKQMISSTFTAAGFRVIDIGENCSALQFVQAVKKHKANVVGCSAMLSSVKPYCKVVVDALVEAGLRDKVIVVIGGWHMAPEWVKESGADCFGVNAVDGLHKVQKLLAEKKKK